MPKAFISYAREDKDFVAGHLLPILNALGVDTWIDTENLHGAERWREMIKHALPACEYFIVVATTAAAASPVVRAEVEWILQNRADRLIPILAGRVRFDGIHPELPNIQHVDCVEKTPGRTGVLIARALLHLVERRAEILQSQKIGLNDEFDRKHAEWESANQKLIMINNELENEVKTTNLQLDQVLSFDGDWHSVVGSNASQFVPRSQRNASIIAVMNVKGGVGKSTLAANLAATWWGRKADAKRVLLVDLDFQQSLTSLCLSHRDLQDLRSANLFVNSLFDEDIAPAEHLLRSIRRVGRAEGYVLASDENLTRVETQRMALWLTNQLSKDVRFLLRELLHGPVVQERFDCVIIDCPPRIHTASVNALAAADFLLIPVLLDLTSADSVPRMLSWVQKYREAAVCPQLELLGVVANKKSDRRNELLVREENLWRELPGKCRIAWGGEVPFFKTVIPNSAAIAECSQTPGKFACEDSRISSIFSEFARECDRQMAPLTELAL